MCTTFQDGTKKGEKKGRNKKAYKSKNNQRKVAKKSNLPQGSNDLTNKLFQTMEKHKEVSTGSLNFFQNRGTNLN